MTVKSHEEVFKYLLDNNRPEYNYLKLAEELAELQEVVIKKITKHPSRQPSIDKFIEEMSDVTLRINLLAYKLGIKEDIEKYIKNKLEKRFAGYINDSLYVGGI